MIRKTVDATELPAVAAELAKELTGTPGFCLWLVGPLGAGKTTLTGHILRALGHPKDAPVTSPTYTYMNEYKIGGHWYAHLDLYRANASFSTEELGLLDARPFQGVFVEWPEKAPNDVGIRPTHVLTVGFTENEHLRDIALENRACAP